MVTVAAPDLILSSVRITTPTSLHVETARYLCYRASQLWPTYYATDTVSGDQFSHRGFWLPTSFLLAETVDGGPQIQVRITPTQITLDPVSDMEPTGEKAAACAALMELLADDPIWGPAWTLPVTRYFN